MNARAPITDPTDIGELVKRLCDERFLQVVMIRCGREPDWRAAVAQLPDIFATFRENGIPDVPVYEYAASLFVRAEKITATDFRKLHTWFSQTIGHLVDADKLNGFVTNQRPVRPGPGERISFLGF